MVLYVYLPVLDLCWFIACWCVVVVVYIVVVWVCWVVVAGVVELVLRLFVACGEVWFRIDC